MLFAAGAAGCGDTGSELVPERTAARRVEFVDKVEAAMAQEECSQARDAARAGRRRAAGLSSKVDEELKASLIDGFEHLEDEVRKECNRRQKPKETPTPDPTPTATAEPEETATPEPTPTATQEPEETPTAEPEETPTEEPPADEDVGDFEE